MLPGRQPFAKACCLLALAPATLLIAACGSSSPSTSATNAAVARTVSATSAATKSTHGAPSGAKAPLSYAKTHRDVVKNGVVTHRPLHGTGGAEINDDNPGRADVGNSADAGHKNPCTLVSSAEARSILGKALRSVTEAPLGPTCIYQPAGSKQLITVAVQSIDFATIKAHMRDRAQLSISGHTGYCGTYGAPTTFVPLPHGETLTVTAPCAIGARFAATAVPRLTA